MFDFDYRMLYERLETNYKSDSYLIHCLYDLSDEHLNGLYVFLHGLESHIFRDGVCIDLVDLPSWRQINGNVDMHIIWRWRQAIQKQRRD